MVYDGAVCAAPSVMRDWLANGYTDLWGQNIAMALGNTGCHLGYTHTLAYGYRFTEIY